MAFNSFSRSDYIWRLFVGLPKWKTPCIEREQRRRGLIKEVAQVRIFNAVRCRLVRWILPEEDRRLGFAKYSLIDQHPDLASSSDRDLILLRL